MSASHFFASHSMASAQRIAWQSVVGSWMAGCIGSSGRCVRWQSGRASDGTKGPWNSLQAARRHVPSPYSNSCKNQPREASLSSRDRAFAVLDGLARVQSEAVGLGTVRSSPSPSPCRVRVVGLHVGVHELLPHSSARGTPPTLPRNHGNNIIKSRKSFNNQPISFQPLVF